MRFLDQGIRLAGVLSALLLSSVAAESRCFPDEFMFGSATAAYQVEGAWNESGRTPSIYDAYCRETPGIECANVADDFFHRYRDDVKLMVETGLQSFRFSTSWSRAMTWDPQTRRMRPNPPGLAFYHSLIDELNANHITPILTLHHYDLPLALQDELDPQAWLNPDISTHFEDYATLMFNEFGKKVKFWTTFNEPLGLVGYGYGMGFPNMPPAHRGSPTEAYEVSYGVLMCHAKAVKKFRELRDSGVVDSSARISIVLVSSFFYPLDPTKRRDVLAAQRALDFDFGWFLQPILTGDYPAVMREIAGDRLPRFTAEESALLNGSYDMFQLNHYSSQAVTDCDSPTSTVDCASLAPGWQADKGVDDTHVMPGTLRPKPDRFGNNYCANLFTPYPPGYLDMIRYVHSQDPTVDILLTENGWCGNGEVENYDQVHFFEQFVGQVYKAVVEEKIPVIGYTAWSFLDNFEWGSYKPRFGMYYVNWTSETGSPDFNNPKPTDLARIPRPSAKWFHQLSTTRCLDDNSVFAIEAFEEPTKDLTKLFGAPLVTLGVVAVVVMVGIATQKRRQGYGRIPLSSAEN
ncbi:glycoside hydrolase, putative [Phytophthora infestans T30-4]|uniref:Glycoside hydrolase, putative n=3 Tax=Phytophthora infestans TaxID=4787 RepID=D0MT51_PHYIT|nr:glycoside hydrolase, putative [Phytophthora infestans T30-4]EEY61148.1 glycoside hydrolase, putative [Phytophthora infestans T30-4]KAF4039721.1 Glycosyl hydrolase family 1 [Phytophthora infestans]KAF4147302.1 Glycosyl hydrolase family 1 [Phytophthora infestans]KAI9987503.1 hypothetical protein PInf_023542 [Phytophthora infestans]|eukprot:XP_002908065.1 glycoside hydrolase, putative [Phytophthora infestans T30-4]